MAVTYNKPAGLKYTDMCIYIDANMDKVLKTGENPEIESRIYEYLYHILYALACKQSFFKKFEDYDDFALYGASELYISMRNKYMNAGKEVRGKEVKPIKSCLNFIKSVLFPLKVNYQRKNYAEVFNPEIDQNTTILNERLRDSVKSDYRSALIDDLNDILLVLPNRVKSMLNKTPYRYDELMLKRLYLSCLLTFISSVTIPNKLENKLDKKRNKDEDEEILSIYTRIEDEVILWHLPEDMSDYVKLLYRKIKNIISEELNDARRANELSDETVDDILATAYSTYDARSKEE